MVGKRLLIGLLAVASLAGCAKDPAADVPSDKKVGNFVYAPVPGSGKGAPGAPPKVPGRPTGIGK